MCCTCRLSSSTTASLVVPLPRWGRLTHILPHRIVRRGLHLIRLRCFAAEPPSPTGEGNRSPRCAVQAYPGPSRISSPCGKCTSLPTANIGDAGPYSFVGANKVIHQNSSTVLSLFALLAPSPTFLGFCGGEGEFFCRERQKRGRGGGFYQKEPPLPPASRPFVKSCIFDTKCCKIHKVYANFLTGYMANGTI